ncbi:MAG: MBL fold metallo-hydrolase [Anaerolineae bacterium]|jgi:7,8-dihydropterin-6-yl-methyl-4-(beta-D-ribofuranosyl)aminobenzene 5'-phosphate synthase|nr:MBL fold metallo-hydrolase [Anaerolineae bacterium]
MISLRCVVENSVLPSSRLWAEHGVSFHIETPDGQVLFDTGQSGEVLLHNAARLGIDLAHVDAFAISHAHYDHTGGLRHAFKHTRPMIPLYANADLFRERYSRRGEDYEKIGLPLARAEIAAHVELRLSDEPAKMLPGVWTTGRIVDRSEFEGRSVGHRIFEDGEWLPDPYRDDLSLVLETGDGLVVICGCCHAGLLNTLAHVKRVFKRDIIAVLGGTHLTSATDAMLKQAINTLRTDYGTPRLYPNHCTGRQAYARLAEAFGDKVQPCPAGTVLAF